MTWPRSLRVDAEDSTGGWWGTVFPVGALFFSAVDVDPGISLGFGVWAPFGKGAVLIGAGGVTLPAFMDSPMPNAVPTVAVFIFVRLS